MKIIAIIDDRTRNPRIQKDMEGVGYTWNEEEGYWQKEVRK